MIVILFTSVVSGGPPIFVHAMPAINPGGSNPPQRTTFRPPWVKESPDPHHVPTAPWTLARNRDSGIASNTGATNKPAVLKGRAATENDATAASTAIPKTLPNKGNAQTSSATPKEPVQVRKQSKITIIPSMPSSKPKENGHQNATAVTSKPKEDKTIKPEEIKRKSSLVESKPKSTVVEVKSLEKNKPNKVLERTVSIDKVAKEKPPEPTTKPPAPPMPPPPPPGMKKTVVLNRQPVGQTRPEKAVSMARESKVLPPVIAEKLETLKSRPRKRPDWGAMMKAIETGKKLKHVQCNDRSSPLLACEKVKEQREEGSERELDFRHKRDSSSVGVRGCGRGEGDSPGLPTPWIRCGSTMLRPERETSIFTLLQLHAMTRPEDSGERLMVLTRVSPKHFQGKVAPDRTATRVLPKCTLKQSRYVLGRQLPNTMHLGTALKISIKGAVLISRHRAES
uniref:WH2 domain-containing protein n=1 Tax=Timema tahoe TaxID=61484 RepID=A0A7R9FIT2_9NEOP|nr:unnamed protein product [Timema tahoe]